MRLFLTFENLPAGVGFGAFSGVHIAWLLAGAALTAALGILGRRLEAPGRKALRRALGAALIALEATRVAALVATGVYDVYYLPLHLCGLAVFLTIAHAFSGGTLLGELLYSLCMPGAACALLFPDWTDLPAWNLLCILSFSIHILLVAYPAALLSWGELQPRAKRLPVCFALLATAAVPIYILDKAIDANFFFFANCSNKLNTSG